MGSPKIRCISQWWALSRRLRRALEEDAVSRGPPGAAGTACSRAASAESGP